MTRRFVYLLAACLLSGAVLAAGVFFYRSLTAEKVPSLQEALGTSDSNFVQRLYPASSTESVPGSDSPMASSVRIGNKIYVINRDHSTVDLEVQPGAAIQIVRSQSYYPVQPGESGRRPHKRQLYGVLPGVTFDEEVLRLDSTMSEHTQKLDDKTEIVMDFGEDGTTVVGNKLIVPVEYGDPRIQKEERWRMDAGHTLKYRNVFNADETRTVTEYDDHMRVLKQINWPKYETAAGSTVIEYYPVSFKLKMKASADYYNNVADYFSEAGIETHRVTLSPGFVKVEYFDAAGKVVIREQSFFRRIDKVDGVDKIFYDLYITKAFDNQGNEVREIEYIGHDSHMREDERFDVTVDGVTYKRLDYEYDTDGTLQEITYWKDKVEYPPLKKEEHKPSEKIYLDKPVPDEMKSLGVEIDEDLPVPPPQRGPEGY